MEFCPEQLAADAPSHSLENSAASPVLGAAGEPASFAREYTCLDFVYEGPAPVHPGMLRRQLLPLGLASCDNARRVIAIYVAPHPACGETTCLLN